MDADSGQTNEEFMVELNDKEREKEQIKRENQLFESHIMRESDGIIEDNIMGAEIKKKDKRKDKDKKSYTLTADDKHMIANQELQSLKKDIEEGRDKSDRITDELKAILEETDMQISSIKKEAFEFRREIVANGENERTGKVMAEKLVKYMDEMKRKKDDAIAKLEKKNKLLCVKVSKAEQQIKQKEEMGDDLKFIDFHQLEIENKKHVKEIDEKNKKLLSLKISSGDTIESLNGLKKELEKKEKELNDKRNDILNVQKNVIATKINIAKIKKKNEFLKDEYNQLESTFKSTQSHTSEVAYIKAKKELEEKRKELSELERTVKIHKSLAKASKKMLENNNA